VITRAKIQLERLPEARLFAALRFDSVADGVRAFRAVLQDGYRPSVIRLYDETATATSLAPVVGEQLDGVCALVACEGPPAAAETTREAVLAHAGANGATGLPGRLTETWWERRYDFYHPPHHPELPAVWGTLEFVVAYERVLGAYDALRASIAPYEERGLVLKIHLSHWYHWGTMLYGRFVVADGGPDAVELHDAVWRDAVAAGLGAGAVMNDHHGVGLKLAPFMQQQYGPSLELLRRIKRGLDPNGVMNPGKLGL
jgi:alkyldihydroxyacetonephosphate synthase